MTEILFASMSHTADYAIQNNDRKCVRYVSVAESVRCISLFRKENRPNKNKFQFMFIFSYFACPLCLLNCGYPVSLPNVPV